MSFVHPLRAVPAAWESGRSTNQSRLMTAAEGGYPNDYPEDEVGYINELDRNPYKSGNDASKDEEPV